MTESLNQQLEFIVDHDAEPTDWDQALAKFLLQLIRSNSWPADTLEPNE